MMKMLVTGASGFLGKRVARYYDSKYEVITPSHADMDICNSEEVSKVLHETKPQIVIHCAAISDVGVCEKNPEASYQYNVLGMLHIAKVCKEIGATCILCSSDQVYFGCDKDEALKEDEHLEPKNIYGRDKLRAEQLCLQENPDCICLRLSWMYDKETLSDKEHSDFIRTFKKNMEQGMELRYAVNDYRGLTNVNEVVANMEKLLGIPGGVYNFGAPNTKNMYRTVCDVFELLSWDAKRVWKNETSFQDKRRNITMNQEKINAYQIYFKDTTQGLYEMISSMNLEKKENI